MNTPIAVKSKIDYILNELPRLGSFQFADANAERQRVHAILTKILEQRALLPLLCAFEEKILAKALNVYDAYVDSAMQRKLAGEIILRPLHTIASIQPELLSCSTGESYWIKSVLKSQYPLTMPDDLILKLESVRDCDFRIRLEEGYTDPAYPDLYGMAHSDHFQLLPEGYLRRDESGQPRLYATSRSALALPLAMQDVVRLEFANKNHGGELWRHPHYRLNDGCLSCYTAADFLARSRLLAKVAKNQWRYEIRIYDMGKLVLHSENLTIRPTMLAKQGNEQRLPVAALHEFLTKLMSPGPRLQPELLTYLDEAHKTWLHSERAARLRLMVEQALAE